MNSGLLLDTHIVLWLDSGSDRLRRSTRDLIDGCWQDGGTIYLSSVSAWEIALLVDMKRIALDLPADEWVERFVGRRGVEALPLDLRAAARAYQLAPFAPRDSADRLLITTAIGMGCPLVTYDSRIAAFAKRHGRRHAFAAAR